MSMAEIPNLTLHEKLQFLEVIWDDLSARADEMAVSTTVRDLLDERVERKHLFDDFPQL